MRIGPLRLPSRTVVVVIVLLAVVVGVIRLLGSGGNEYTLYFSEAKGLYPGNAVDVIGVQVGTVQQVVPEANAVRVTIKVDSGVTIPADAKAAITTPSLVPVRHIALSPAYVGGPEPGTAW